MSRKLLSDDLSKEIVAQYDKGLTATELAKRYNVNASVMFVALKRWGAKMRKSGDYSREGSRNNQYRHGHTCGPHRKEFYAFLAARKRCTDSTLWCYNYYGGRGIQFKFVDFEQFIADVGPAPTSKHTLDRINNNGHYEPGNVRWATRHEQVLNRRPYKPRSK